MSTYINKTRRSFVHILVCLGFFTFFRPAYAFIKQGASRTSDPLASSLASFFTHKESAAIMGFEYLRYRPGEANIRLLVDLICACRPERHAELAQAETKKCRELLARQQRQDFEHNRVVKVHGWILSETEARLCALAALI
jgi:hypothetical protein